MLLQDGEGLKITVEIHGGAGLITELSAVGLQGSLDGVNPNRLVSRVMQRDMDCDEHHVLIGHLGCGDIVNGTRALRLSALDDRNYSRDHYDDNQPDQHDLRGRQVTLGGAELLADVKPGAGLRRRGRRRGLRRGARSGRGRGVDRCFVGHSRPIFVVILLGPKGKSLYRRGREEKPQRTQRTMQTHKERWRFEFPASRRTQRSRRVNRITTHALWLWRISGPAVCLGHHLW